jgi:hypothetical protein
LSFVVNIDVQAFWHCNERKEEKEEKKYVYIGRRVVMDYSAGGRE